MPEKFGIPSNLEPVGDICVPLFIPRDDEYVMMILKMIRFLTQDRFYDRDEDKSALVIRDIWQQRTLTPLVQALAEEEGCQSCSDGSCLEYAPYADFITFLPQDPYTQPDYVPAGYSNPPFWAFFYTWDTILPDVLDDTLIDIAEWTTGYLKGDVLLPITGFPLLAGWDALLTEGLPRIKIDVTGEGIIELHLLQVPLGGRALISVDVEFDPLDIINGLISGGFELVELNRDVLAIPPETDSDHIQEVEITGIGDHTIYITFLPTVDDAIIPLNYGGGLRKVVLCGGLQPVGSSPLPDPLEDYTDVIPEFRLTNACTLEYRLLDAANENTPLTAWLEVQGWTTEAATCFQGADGLDGLDGADGADGANGADGADGAINDLPQLPTVEDVDELCGAANYIADQIAQIIADTYVATQSSNKATFLSDFLGIGGFIAAALSLWYDWGELNGYAGIDFDTGTTYKPLLIEYLYCAALDMTATKDSIDADGTMPQLVKDAYKNTIDTLTDGKIALWAFLGSQNTGYDCSSYCPDEWCYQFDVANGLLENATPVNTGTGERAVWVAGQGWARGVNANTDNYIYISLAFGQTVTITRVTWVVAGGATQNGWINVPAYPNQTYVDGSLPSGNNWDVTLPTPMSTDSISVGGASFGAMDAGDRLTQVRIYGTGSNPFGADNCM